MADEGSPWKTYLLVTVLVPLVFVVVASGWRLVAGPELGDRLLGAAGLLVSAGIAKLTGWWGRVFDLR